MLRGSRRMLSINRLVRLSPAIAPGLGTAPNIQPSPRKGRASLSRGARRFARGRQGHARQHRPVGRTRGGAAAHAVGPAAVLVGRDYSTAGVLADDSPDTVTFSWFGCVGHMGKSSMRAISWEGWRGRSRVGSLVE